MTVDQCPECGAQWRVGHTCEDDFHQLLAWESENPALGEVHHLTVLCYHLQHPSLYSPQGLAHARALLTEFVERGTSPQAVRRRMRVKVDSRNRNWNIQGKPGARGAYDRPPAWTIRAADVVAGGTDHYMENVRAWARSMQAALT